MTLTRRILDRRYAERDIDQSAILVPPDGFIMLDTLSATDAIKDHGLFIRMVRRYQDQNRLADDFVGRVAEQTFRAIDSSS